MLLKTVAQALPNYVMSVCLLPFEICRDLENLMCQFCGRSNSGKTKSIHRKSWENMCIRKSSGGLGFRNIRDFDVALLGKQIWKMLTCPDKLVTNVFKARYFSQ